MSDWRLKISAHKKDLLIGLAIFVVTLTTFIFSRVRQLGDSTYSLAVSESLLSHGSFILDYYALPRMERRERGNYVSDGDIYQLEWVGDHLYYFLPPGSSVLSVPYVALMNLFGINVVNKDGTYSFENEVKLQIGLAALLMAGLASTFFLTGRLLLSRGWSVLVALGGAWGTQVWSTASRALWSDTWGIFLLGIVVWVLLADAVGRARLRPVLLATLLAWTYFVRPTFAIAILAITVYMLINSRRLFVWYAATGIIWFAGFIAYSWHSFGQALPNYYVAGRLTFDHFGEALAGNLISPARGLLIYVPVVLFIFYLLIRYRKNLVLPRLALLALVVISVHWIVTSGFPHWYGGHSYGPRLMTGVVPWIILLAILGIKAMLRAREDESNARPLTVWRVESALGCTLLLLSVIINMIGATSHATSRWNERPVDVDEQPSRIWDWRHPQFLATWQRPDQ